MYKPLEQLYQRALSFYQAIFHPSRVRAQVPYASLSAFFGCIQLISDTVAQLDIQVFRRGEEGMRYEDEALQRLLNLSPTPWMGKFDFVKGMVVQAIIHGHAYAIKEMDPYGRVTGLRMVPSQQMVVSHSYAQDGSVIESGYIYHPSLEINGISAQEQVYTENEVIHLQGYSADGMVAEPIANIVGPILDIAEQANAFASAFFSPEGVSARGIVELQDMTAGMMTSDAGAPKANSWIDAIKKAFSAKNGVAVLPQGAKFTPMSLDPASTQMQQSREFQVLEICRVFRVPPSMIGVQSATSYSSLVQENQKFLQSCIQPWVSRLQGELNRKLSDDGGLHIEIDTFPLLRADPMQRAEYYTKLHAIGAISAAEVRELEGFQEDPRASKDFYVPLNMTMTNTSQQQA